MPYCMGTLYWQINDCWPVASWSSIDHYQNWKALHYFAKKAYSNLIISANNVRDSLEVYLISDELNDIKGTIKLTAYELDGKEISNFSSEINVEANSCNKYLKVPIKQIIKNSAVRNIYVSLKFISDEKELFSQIYYFVDPGELKLSNPELEYTLSKDEKGVTIEISAKRLAKNVWLNIADQDLFLSDNYFDVLPGTKKKIYVKNGIGPDILKEKLNVVSLIDTY